MIPSNKFYTDSRQFLTFFVISIPLIIAQDDFRPSYLYESIPASRITLSDWKKEGGFSLAPNEDKSGKFLVSVSLISFLCRIENNDPAPYLNVYGENGIYKRWNCDDLESRQVWLTLDALAGNPSFKITISNDTKWQEGWEAKILGTLYQTNYTLAGACPQGYFDCKSPSAMCLGQNRQHDTQRCIPEMLVCNNSPSCGMLCNADEADICNRETTQRNKPGNDESEFPTWAYYVIGGVAFGGFIFYCSVAYIRHRKIRNARLIRDGIKSAPVIIPAPIQIPAPVEPSWFKANPSGGASRRNSRDVSETVTVPVFGPMKDYDIN